MTSEEPAKFYELFDGPKRDRTEAVPPTEGLDFFELWERASQGKQRAAPTSGSGAIDAGSTAAYISAALRAEVEAVRSCPQGHRNHRLNVAAFNLGQLVHAGLHPDVIAFELGVAARDCGLEEREIGPTISSGLTAGMEQPREIPASWEPPPVTVLHDPQEPARPPLLAFHTVPELRARVAARGPRRWLVRGWWPAGAYGVHGAEQKAQKTWNAVDLAVSVASGTPWLGAFEVDDPGPVLIFAGEGGEAATLRRIDAVAASRGLDADTLAITVCTRAPHLGDTAHMVLFAEALHRYAPRLVILDPLYLAAKGAKLGDLYAMGALLERPQHMCDDADASLLVVTHHNRGEGRGAHRLTGAGPAEWGRVLINGTVISRHTDPQTKATRVLTELDGIGGEIPDQTARVLRHICADDPDDLDSALRYEVSVTDVEAPMPAGTADMPPARAKLLEALQAADEPQTSAQLVDWIADRHGHGLKRETVSRHLKALLDLSLIDCINPDARFGEAKLWALRAV